ncbi:MAG: glycoside hydrolase family 97 protein [Ignavibacteriales bacterium]|nr:glycoside hydrolase family 97 protein [Ignavibacteriales bacterium]MCF8316857.1 glycoside hydrolase family 97 protein [Ignavibacteriales bacterium]MCF8438104.1 glycoside hydrolase family 97 protein [Ignavibacteriales bacterium]
MRKRLILCLSFLVFAGYSILSAENISSPDGKITLEFLLQNGSPFYKVLYEGKTIISESALGYKFRNLPALESGFTVSSSKKISYDNTWQQVWGERKLIREKYNGLYMEIEQKVSGKTLGISFRIFNDGVAFRYFYPESNGDSEILVSDELTEFRLGADHQCWWIPGDHDSYEYHYNTTKFSEIDAAPYKYYQSGDRNIPDLKAVNTPLTMKTVNGLYLLFHEAALIDYPDMTLKARSDYSLKAELVPWKDGVKVKAGGSFESPWRVVLISPALSGLFESNTILNLNDPNKLEDVSWIEPMKYAGVWWEMHIGKSSWSPVKVEGSWANDAPAHGATTENTKKYIDFASANNIKGILVEGWNTGWEYWGKDTAGYFDFVTPTASFDIEWLIDYAGKKGVELIGHHETGGQADNYEMRLENAMKYYNSLGIRAVKTGYAGSISPKGERHHGQYMVRHYRKVLETAAKYGIMVDAHEPIKDTGERRTFPNMMAREGMKGMEWNAWSDGNPPEHVTILPFTRGIAGPMDYTPGIFDLTFDKYKQKERVQSTLANQLALYVVLYSPLQMAADLVENYEGNPAFEFIRKVPVDWENSLLVAGEIGDYCVIARENSGKWYLGAVTDENKREIEIELNFLEQGAEYSMNYFADNEKSDYLIAPHEISIGKRKVTGGSKIIIPLGRGGGFAAEFVK